MKSRVVIVVGVMLLVPSLAAALSQTLQPYMTFVDGVTLTAAQLNNSIDQILTYEEETRAYFPGTDSLKIVHVLTDSLREKTVGSGIVVGGELKSVSAGDSLVFHVTHSRRANADTLYIGGFPVASFSFAVTSGYHSFQGYQVSDTLSVRDSLTVFGITRMGGTTTLSGATTASGGFTLTGALTANAGVHATFAAGSSATMAHLHADSLSIGDSLTVLGPATLAGATTLSGAVTQAGNWTANAGVHATFAAGSSAQFSQINADTVDVDNYITVADNAWMGFGSAAGRIEWDDQATAEINFLSSYVGIGVTDPAEALQVLTDEGGEAIAIEENSGNEQWEFGVDAAGDLNFQNDGSISVAFTDPGSYGFGVSAPKNTLDVEGNAAIGASYSGTNNAPANGLIVEGYVGIGKDDPAVELDVSGAATISGNLTISGDLAAGAGVHAVFSPGSTVHMAHAIADTALFGSITSAFSANSSADEVSIRSDSDAGLSVLTPATQSGWVMFGDPGSAKAGFMRYNHATDMLSLGVGGAPLMYLSSAGGVGLGTLPYNFALNILDNYASYPLSIVNLGDNANRFGITINAGAYNGSGNTIYLNCADGDGDQVGYIWNTSGTFQLVDASDRRLKANIIDAPIDGLSIVKKLQVREFEYASHSLPKTRAIGFIAQEVAQVYPRAAAGDSTAVDLTRLDAEGKPKPQMMGVAVEALVPVLVKAMQEQETKIDALEADNTRLWNQIADLNRRLQLIEK